MTIYSDRGSKYDSDTYCSEREGACLNCGRPWLPHRAWACPTGSAPHASSAFRFSEVPAHSRFETREMRDSLGPETKRPKTRKTKPDGPDLSDWRTWAHNKPGDCPCGVAREVCDYHR